MNNKDFLIYIPILQEKPFELYPAPKGIDNNRFTYIDDEPTYIKIEHISTHKTYALPLAVVEFATPGVLRVSREVVARNGSLV
jgi:hypothetical protein